MRTCFILSLLILLSCSTTPTTSTPKLLSTEESAQLLLQNTDVKTIIDNIAMNEIYSKHCSGVVVGIVTPLGEEYFAYGLKDVEKNEPMTTDALFQIGSITKIFTSSLLLKLDQEKVVSITDPLKKLFPADFKPETPNLGDLTFETLSDHSSGLPAEYKSFDMMNNAIKFLFTGQNIWASFEEPMMWDFFGTSDFGPLQSRSYKYSNTAYIFLGNLLARAVPGIDYETLLEQKILTPMQLTDTKFDLNPEQQKRMSKGYSGDAPPLMFSGKYMEPWEIKKGLRSAGSLHSSAKDMINFLKMNMKISSNPVQFDFERAHEKRVQTKDGYVGLGWFIETLPQSKREYIYANGIISGYTSFMGFDDKSKVGIVVLQNAMNMKNEIGKHLLDRLVYNYNQQGLNFKLSGIPKTELSGK